jgi:transcriptional regulator with XRE-family HTH domain
MEMALVIRVRELREAKGWTQAELAREAKVRPSTLVEIEKGRTSRIDLAVLERLADALDVAPGFLIAREAKRGKGK